MALEWIPLFLLFWYRLVVEQPSVQLAVAAGTLLATTLCSYYYGFYSILAAGVMVVWQGWRTHDFLFLFRRRHRMPLTVFLMMSGLTTGLLLGALWFQNVTDPITPTHTAEHFPLDLLAPFIPGGHWRFAELTRPYWPRLQGNIHETSVALGWTVLFLCGYVWSRRRRLSSRDLSLWFLTGAVFAILSLGPTLHVWGWELSGRVLPYAWLEQILPSIKLSGDPVRMFVMVTLSASLISAAGLQMLWEEGRRRWIVVIVGVLAIEYLPKPLPATQLATPVHVRILKELPGHAGCSSLPRNRLGNSSTTRRFTRNRSCIFPTTAAITVSGETQGLSFASLAQSSRKISLLLRNGSSVNSNSSACVVTMGFVTSW